MVVSCRISDSVNTPLDRTISVRQEFTKGHRGQVIRASMLKGATLGKIIKKFEEQPEIRKDKMKKKRVTKGSHSNHSPSQFNCNNCQSAPSTEASKGPPLLDGRQYVTPKLITIDPFDSNSDISEGGHIL